MKTTKRFDEAVTKLYNAFNEGTLDAGSCEHCAVGNICRNNGDWQYFLKDKHGSGVVYNPYDLLALDSIRNTGYSPLEIVTIEKIFIDGVGRDEDGLIISGKKEEQFNGLMAVIEYLASLDNIEIPKITIEQFESVLKKETI